MFLDKLSAILKTCKVKEVLRMDDFNLNWLDKTRRKQLQDIANKFHLTQLIENPTRIKRFSKTLLDLIFTD